MIPGDLFLSDMAGRDDILADGFFCDTAWCQVVGSDLPFGQVFPGNLIGLDMPGKNGAVGNFFGRDGSILQVTVTDTLIGQLFLSDRVIGKFGGVYGQISQLVRRDAFRCQFGGGHGYRSANLSPVTDSSARC